MPVFKAVGSARLELQNRDSVAFALQVSVRWQFDICLMDDRFFTGDVSVHCRKTVVGPLQSVYLAPFAGEAIRHPSAWSH